MTLDRAQSENPEMIFRKEKKMVWICKNRHIENGRGRLRRREENIWRKWAGDEQGGWQARSEAVNCYWKNTEYSFAWKRQKPRGWTRNSWQLKVTKWSFLGRTILITAPLWKLERSACFHRIRNSFIIISIHVNTRSIRGEKWHIFLKLTQVKNEKYSRSQKFKIVFESVSNDIKLNQRWQLSAINMAHAILGRPWSGGMTKWQTDGLTRPLMELLQWD